MDTVRDIKPTIRRVGTSEDLARTALENFINRACASIKSRDSFHVAISGGQTPERFFELLADSSEADTIDWQKVHLFWVDERCVSPEAEGSNYGLAAHTFLSKVDIPTENVHRMPGECQSLDEAAGIYGDTIRRVFGLGQGQIPQFDLIMLGMGTDGHIGSLYPNSYAQFDTDDIVTTIYLMDGDYNRITLTYPVLHASRHLILLVSGQEKASILKEVLQSEPDEVKYPVHKLWPILDKVTWIIDSQAAELL